MPPLPHHCAGRYHDPRQAGLNRVQMTMINESHSSPVVGFFCVGYLNQLTMQTSDQQLFRVAFKGLLTGEYDLESTKKRLARLFRLDTSKIDKLFSGKEWILKNNVEEKVALQYAIKIAEAGCECYIEAVPDENDISQQPGFVERRKGERRVRHRRGPRPGAIIPDRRINPGRRREDREKEAVG